MTNEQFYKFKNFSWNNSENIILKRIEILEKNIYNNTTSSKKSFKAFGEVCFYVLPYLEILINNFPYLKFICTTKSRQKTYDDIMTDITNENNFLLRLFLFRKKFKNHFINHNGKKWQKDYILDKNERVLKKGKVKLKITEKEINFIENLHVSSKPLSREFILKNIWNYSTDTDTHTVETHIYRLRQKIKNQFKDNSFIKNSKKGYSL